MALIDKIKAQAKANVKHIVLPEGEEVRNIQAALSIVESGIARLTLLGDKEKAAQVAGNLDISGLDYINPAASDKAAGYAEQLYEIRKAKGMTPEKAAELVADPMYYGIMMSRPATRTAWFPARSTPPATCCARRCRSSRRSPACAPFPPAS